jgi:tellurite resistance-related uncharacterized protein
MPATPSILLFMDDAGVLSSLEFSLSLNGFAVADGSNADPSAAAALVIDQAWRGDGLALLESLRAAGCAAPAVLLATNPTRALRLRTAAAEAIIVEKPLLGDELNRVLDGILKGDDVMPTEIDQDPIVRLPDGAEPYKRTGTFTETTVPAALLDNHSTKHGAWGLLHVEQGRLRYVVTDPRRPASERILTPETPPGVIEPTIVHRVEPLGAVRFYVEFHRAAADPDPAQ